MQENSYICAETLTIYPLRVQGLLLKKLRTSKNTNNKHTKNTTRIQRIQTAREHKQLFSYFWIFNKIPRCCNRIWGGWIFGVRSSVAAPIWISFAPFRSIRLAPAPIRSGAFATGFESFLGSKILCRRSRRRTVIKWSKIWSSRASCRRFRRGAQTVVAGCREPPQRFGRGWIGRSTAWRILAVLAIRRGKCWLRKASFNRRRDFQAARLFFWLAAGLRNQGRLRGFGDIRFALCCPYEIAENSVESRGFHVTLTCSTIPSTMSATICNSVYILYMYTTDVYLIHIVYRSLAILLPVVD